MRPDALREEIVDLLGRNRKAPLSAAEIQAGLKVGSKQSKRLQKAIAQLTHEGAIVQLRKGRYALGAPADLVAGLLSITRSGAGFLDTAEGGSVFVGRDNIGTALPGDRVLVRLDPERRRVRGEESKGPEGRVVRILDRVTRDIVGTLQSTGRFLYVIPLNPAYKHDFYVPDAGEAQVGDRVIVRFTAWTNKHVNPEGEIVEVIGPADHPSVDTESVVREYELPRAFPPAVLDDAELAGNLMLEQEGREDLREVYILTIDPVTARDFDDALSLKRDAAGNRELGVHIADVSHFVRPGSALDKEARIRGNSVYLPDKVIPMLPEQLSNGVCSLRPDEDRLTFSAFLTVDDQGVVIKRRFARTIIRSKERLNYRQAMAVIATFKTEGQAVKATGQTAPGKLSAKTVALLRELHALAQQMRQHRFARFALELDMPECEIEIDKTGRMTGIHVVKNDESHQLIEECMVAANEAVASELRARRFPVIYRVHEAPAETKIEELITTLTTMGYQPGDISQRRNMAAFLRTLMDDPLAHHALVAVLKSMKRAVYSEEHEEHFGLAIQNYAHFTSPIRRYPDLVLHRQLAAFLAGGKAAYSQAEIGAVAAHCSETEQVAEQAERTLIEIKKFRFLEEQLANKNPEIYEAVVAKVTNFGLFVEVIDLQIQGLVHIATLSDSFVNYSRRSNSLRAGKQAYGVGQHLKVFVSNVDFNQRRIDFTLA